MAKGSEIYCPECESHESCLGLHPNYPGTNGSAQRRILGDVHFFARGRECQTCGHWFRTVELEEKYLAELMALRAEVANTRSAIEDLGVHLGADLENWPRQLSIRLDYNKRSKVLLEQIENLIKQLKDWDRSCYPPQDDENPRDGA